MGKYKLGIIGGMGPMASVVLYEMITEKTPAEKDQDHIDMVILNHASMPDRTSVILSKDEAAIESVLNEFRSDLKILKDAGCESFVVTCNTAHFFVDKLQQEGELELEPIHLIKETARACKEAGGKIAILATDGTIQSGLYQNELDKLGVEHYEPSEELQGKIMSLIYDYVKAGKSVPAQLWRDIEDELKAKNCAHAILGCTELSVEKRRDDNPFYINPFVTVCEKIVRK
ncbi:MAG: amino acid racemase [Clostridia bacterium]|nr:amino acid racemase [Clostridia bacterium]